VLLQATTMGLYLSGHDSMLALHRTGAMITAALALLQVIAALLHVSKNRAARDLVPVSVAMLLAIIVQMSFGFAHNVAVHIPLGVAIFGGMVRMGMVVTSAAPKPAEVTEKVEAA